MPIFADHFIANKMHVQDGHDVCALQARVRRAERLVFDTQAIVRVGQVIHDIPELLIEQIQFARAPFDLCWIEFPWKPMIESIYGRMLFHPALAKVAEQVRHF